MRECWNWQTGTFEVRVSMTYGFKSRFSHQTAKRPCLFAVFVNEGTGLEGLAGVNDGPGGPMAFVRPRKGPFRGEEKQRGNQVFAVRGNARCAPAGAVFGTPYKRRTGCWKKQETFPEKHLDIFRSIWYSVQDIYLLLYMRALCALRGQGRTQRGGIV